MSSRVLFIAYLFPPAGGVGVLRALSFSKYLPRLGHEVHVLSALNPTCPTHDPGLLKNVPPEVKLHRVFTPELPFGVRQKLWRIVSPVRPRDPEKPDGEPGLKSKLADYARRFFTPDPEVVWVPFAVRAARRIIQRHAIDVVIVTVPPFSSLMIGTALKREFPNIKLISDFRDEWFQFHLSIFDFHNSSHTWRRAQEIESAAASASDLIVSVAPAVNDQMRQRYPEQPASKFAVIYNGFDPDLVTGFRPRAHEPGKVVITFVGTMYAPSTLRYYLDALAALPDAMRSWFETRIIGRIADEEQETLRNAGDRVKILGFMPQADTFRHMEETDFLLLTMTDPACITGKFYDYIATGKPILALTPKGGEVQRMLADTSAGWWADYLDKAAIRELLIRAHDAAIGGTAPTTPRSAAARFARPELAAELSRHISELTNPQLSPAGNR